jgi:hypothetical protein
MRLTSLLSLALLASLGSPVLAQEWVEFISRDDGFRVNFPGPPAVTSTTFTFGCDGACACTGAGVRCLRRLIPDPWTSP